MVDTQMWIGTAELSPSKFEQPQNQDDPVHKPRGGLWTSTVTDDHRSGWLDWVERESFHSGEEEVWHLEPEDGLDVMIIEDQPHLDAILENYGRDLGTATLATQARTFAPLDFEAIAENYDAIRLTEQGQWNTRMSRPGLYGWDCESVLWLCWAFESIEYQGHIGDYIEAINHE